MNSKKNGAPTHVSYLDKLTFDPKLLLGPISRYLKNLRVVILLVFTIAFLGITSFLTLPKRLNPEIKIPIVTVVTILPGASPEDIESLVTVPLENEIKGLSGIDTLTSVSRENLSAISIQFTSGIDADKAKTDVKNAVETVTTLPTDAQIPNVRALDFEDQPVWVFTLSGKTDDASLFTFSKKIKDSLEDVAQIDRVSLSGYEENEIIIDFDPTKISQYQLSPFQISQLLKNAVSTYPAGSVRTTQNVYSIAIDSDITSLESIRKLKISINGKSVALADLATISQVSKANQSSAFIKHLDGTVSKAITFYVYKTSTANIDDAAKHAQTVVNTLAKPYGKTFSVTTILDNSREIIDQFNEILSEFGSTIVLVFICLFIFLGLRQALISTFTVPLTYLSALFFMKMVGMSINFLSLFAFLLALGLLVDDTIVVVSAMTSYFRSKKFTPHETGLIVWRDTIVPIWSTTITTIWSFVPLLLSTGIIGEFIKPIPVVVTVTMISSTAIAVLITLPFMIVLLKPQVPKRVIVLLKIIALISIFVFIAVLSAGNPFFLIIAIVFIALTLVFRRVYTSLRTRVTRLFHSSRRPSKSLGRLQRYMDFGMINIETVSQKYYRLIYRILSSKSARRKTIIVVLAYAVFSFSLLPLGFVKGEFFPKSDLDLVYLTLQLPSGTAKEVLATQSLEVLNSLKAKSLPHMEFITLEQGKGFSDTGDVSDADSTSLFTIHLDKKVSISTANTLRDTFASYTKGKISVIEQSGGPPAGADVQIKYYGDDLSKLDVLADQTTEFLSKQAGVTNIEKSIKPGTSKLVFIPNKDELIANNLTVDTIGFWLRSYASNFKVSDVNFDKTQSEKTDIVYSIGHGIKGVSDLGTLTIPGDKGPIPLLSLGRIETRANPTSITREEGKRTLSVSAAVKSGYPVQQKNKDLLAFADSLTYPEGYGYKTGGANEENQKSVTSIIQAMGVAAILILVTMVIQFQSYRQAVLVLLVIPLAVSSVFLAFSLTGTPLSFPALIGVLSLFGIVVTNSMFIVDKININRRQGMEFKQAIADAGASRLEPIILTKLCTVLGLLPITISNPLWRGLGGAIISGLLVSSTIMLLFIPVVYYSWFHSEAKEIG